MGLTRYTLYKYVRTGKGWRYLRPACFANGRIKPDTVLVDGQEETHQEGAYYLNVDGRWEKMGEDANAAQQGQARRLARQRYERATGETLPQEGGDGVLLRDAIEGYLAQLDLEVASRAKRPKTLAAARNALERLASQEGLRTLRDVTVPAITRHMASVIRESPTSSARTAANHFGLILSFLKRCGAVPMVGTGRSARPLGLKDAPKFAESPVESYTEEEVSRLLSVSSPREKAIFLTLLRTGMREQELATLRRQDVILDNGQAPYVKVCERPEYGFVPKWYSVRDIPVGPLLASVLGDWLASHGGALVFPSRLGGTDGHLLRLCKGAAKRAGLDPGRCWLHKFRSTYATTLLRKGVDLESLRRLLGHHDLESLGRYVEALRGDDLSRKVSGAFCQTEAAA